jgi:ribosomal protein S13
MITLLDNEIRGNRRVATALTDILQYEPIEARKILSAANISESTRIQDLTEAQLTIIRTEVKDIDLGEMSLSELLHFQMTHPRGLPKRVLTDAQILAEDRIEKGEEDMLRVYRGLKSRLLSGAVQIEPSTKYLDYLMFLWKERPEAFIDSQLSSLDQRGASFLGNYPIIEADLKIRKNRQQGGFIEGMSKLNLFNEIAYRATGNPRNRNAALIIARRKDTDRAIQKMAYRLVMREENELRRERGNKSVNFYDSLVKIDDWFAEKVVTYDLKSVNKVTDLVYDYLTQKRLNFQIVGFDNHYMRDNYNDNMIQIKFVNTKYGGEAVREIVITDVMNMFIDEMDHISFGSRRENEINNFTTKQRAKFQKYVRRGEMLFEYLPEQRQRVLANGPF